MKYFTSSFIIFLATQIVSVENANILAIFPQIQKSHFMMYKKILEELAKRGHSVDIIGVPSPPGKSVPGLNYTDIPDLPTPDIPPLTINQMRQLFTLNFELKFMFSFAAIPLCNNTFNTEVMKNLKNSKKNYDLLIIEMFVCDCFFGFAHTFKAPVVSLISSTDLPWGSYRIGNPDNPAYIPVYFEEYRPYKFLYERFWNVIAYTHAKLGHLWYLQKQNEISRQFFGEDLPHLNEIVANTSLLLMNSHFSLNIARPMLPNVIEVGGLHIGTPKPLDKDIDDFIGTSKFIYLSFGSIVGSEAIDSHTLKNIMEVFSEMNYKVLWKANRTAISEHVEVPSNVLIRPWMSQLDSLCHPNIVLFITHSGLLGTQEAIHCGVPMLCLPLFADQYQNCQNLVDRRVAKKLPIETVTKEEFRKLLRELIEDPRYMENVKKLSQQFKDRPSPPLETAMFWIDYVIRHKGAPQLKSTSISLNWYQYLLLDVGFILLLTVASVLLSSYFILKFLLGRLKNQFSNSQEHKKKQQ